MEGKDLPSSRGALVPVATGTESHASYRATPAAPFLAHLIATARQLPQARERRRAEPGEAIAAYTAALARSLDKAA